MFYCKSKTSDARLCMPPPAPSRGRSRSRDRFQTRVAGVIAAHRRNLRCRRAGQKGQAARRTRATYKHLLGILIEYLGQLLTGFTRRPPPSEVIVRKRQTEIRLRYLEDGNFPANKFEVLPGLREFVRDNHDWREQFGLISKEYIEQLRREVQGQLILNLPERFRRGPRLEPLSSSAAVLSSTVPAPSEEGGKIVGYSLI